MGIWCDCIAGLCCAVCNGSCSVLSGCMCGCVVERFGSGKVGAEIGAGG